MELTAENYKLLIKAEASKLQIFSRSEGTSASYEYMRSVCERLIEISLEMQKQYPNIKAEYSNE